MNEYNIYLWSGAGYTLDKFTTEADHEEEALEQVVAMLDLAGRNYLFFDDCEDLEEMERQGLVLYIDATMKGAKKPHYIDAQNLRIEMK